MKLPIYPFALSFALLLFRIMAGELFGADFAKVVLDSVQIQSASPERDSLKQHNMSSLCDRHMQAVPHRIPYEFSFSERIICAVAVDASSVDASVVITPVTWARIVPDSTFYHVVYLDNVRFSGWLGLMGSRSVHCNFLDAQVQEHTYGGFLYCQILNCDVCNEIIPVSVAR